MDPIYLLVGDALFRGIVVQDELIVVSEISRIYKAGCSYRNFEIMIDGGEVGVMRLEGTIILLSQDVLKDLLGADD